MFTDERARTAYPDWERVADEQAAALGSGSAGDDPHLVQLVDELSVMAGAPFVERWGSLPALPARSGVERLLHPEAGELRLAYEVLDADGQQLVTYLPHDDATAAGIDHLDRTDRRHTTALHAVHG